MDKHQIIRAWKDPEYRNSLSKEERQGLPYPPSGMNEMTDEQLDQAAGAGTPAVVVAGAAVVGAGAQVSDSIEAWVDD